MSPVVKGEWVAPTDDEEADAAQAAADWGTSVAPTKADNARAKAAARANEQPYRDAWAADQAPAGAGRSRRPASKAGRRRPSKAGFGKILRPTSAPSILRGASGHAENGAGLLIGAIAWALVNAYIDYGPAGPRAWLAAKFLNRKGTGPGPGGGLPGASAQGTVTAGNPFAGATAHGAAPATVPGGGHPRGFVR